MNYVVAWLLMVSALWALDEDDLRRRIQQLERRGEWARAVVDYDSLFALRPEDAAVARGLARALSAAGQHERNVVHLQTWLKAHTSDQMAYLLLGDALQQAGRPTEAVGIWRRLLQLRPSDPTVYQQVSDRCQAAGQADEAIAVLLEGRRALGDERVFSWELAALSLQAGQYQRAIALFLQSVEQSPDRLPIVEHQLGPVCQRDDGMLLDALLDPRLRVNPLHRAQLAATCALFAGQPERGLAQVVALPESDERARLLFQYAQQCEARGFAASAIAGYGAYSELSEDGPNAFHALLKRAQLSARHADRAQALAHYAALVERFPERPEALEALVDIARLQLEDGRDPQAVTASLRAVVDAPVSGPWTRAALDLLVESTLRGGDMDGAAGWVLRLSKQGQVAAYAAGVRGAELAYFSGDCAAVIDGLSALTSEAVDHPLANDALDLLLVCEEFKDEVLLPDLVQAQLLERQGQTQRAAVYWDRVIGNATPRLRQWALLQRAVSARERDSLRALAWFEALVEQWPDGRYVMEAQLARAELLQRAGRLEEALRVCEAALLVAPVDARAPELRLHIQRLRAALKIENNP